MMNILLYPNKLLKMKSEAVFEITEEIRVILREMYETMTSKNGVGLAAPQVGIQKRLVVIQVPDIEPLYMINPKIINRSNDCIIFNEGCLSLPNVYADITRNAEIDFQYTNMDGEVVTQHATELLAVCVQHELDHLEGKLYIDRLSKKKRSDLVKEFYSKQELSKCHIQ